MADSFGYVIVGVPLSQVLKVEEHLRPEVRKVFKVLGTPIDFDPDDLHPSEYDWIVEMGLDVYTGKFSPNEESFVIGVNVAAAKDNYDSDINLVELDLNKVAEAQVKVSNAFSRYGVVNPRIFLYQRCSS
jgi:hypothetical protein